MKKSLIVLTGLFFATVTNLNATPIAGIMNDTVSGSDMDGMLVTVQYLNGTSSTSAWKAGTGNSGGANDRTNWSLSFNGSNTWYSNYLDDFTAPGIPNTPDRRAYWDFQTTEAVAAITIDAIAGNTVFDIFAKWDDQGNETGFSNTEGSADGWWQFNNFLNNDTSGFNYFAWEFTDAITIDGVVAEDLFGSLTISFDNPNTQWTELMTGQLSFGVDTDKVAPVPEPATIVLFSLGLLGLTCISRKRKQ